MASCCSDPRSPLRLHSRYNCGVDLPETMPSKTPKALSSEDIQRAVLKRLELYNELNFLEESAMFMGKAQLLEIALKQLLARR
jgi:hypothetical protein